MDLVAQYAHAYGGPPPAELPWLRFLALVQRLEVVEGIDRLRLMDSTAWGAATALGGDRSGGLQAARRTLERLVLRERAPHILSVADG